MDEQTRRNIELHYAGAIIRHKSPFENLEHFESETEIDKEFINHWNSNLYSEDINPKFEHFNNLLIELKNYD